MADFPYPNGLEESVDLLSRNSGSFHFQEGRVPEYLLKYEAITVRVPLPTGSLVSSTRLALVQPNRSPCARTDWSCRANAAAFMSSTFGSSHLRCWRVSICRP